MAPRTPKAPDSGSPDAEPDAGDNAAKKAKREAAMKTETRERGEKRARPALKVVDGTETAPASPILKLKDLIDAVAEVTGGKKPEVKKTVEATLSALGQALAAGRALAVPPLGKLRVVKNTGPALTLKLRLADGAKAAGLALADDSEDS